MSAAIPAISMASPAGCARRGVIAPRTHSACAQHAIASMTALIAPRSARSLVASSLAA
jgi:hypothetical protein